MTNFRIAPGQVAYCFLLVGVAGPLILLTNADAGLSASLLFAVLSIVGLVLCRSVQSRLNDPALTVLGYLWLLKLSLMIFLVYVSWMPMLAIGGDYDPIRYYFQAKQLVEDDWKPTLIAINYAGILYYYGAMFALLGQNPVIPALLNSFVTLIAALHLLQVGYEIKDQRTSNDWLLAFALVLPEVLWFDVITSRETLVAGLLVFGTLTLGCYLARTRRLSLARVCAVTLLSSGAIAAIRTSMLIPLGMSIVLMIILIRPIHASLFGQKVVFALVGGAAIVGLSVAGFLGEMFDVADALAGAMTVVGNTAESADVIWSDSSIGMQLLPNGAWQAALYLVPRMLLYLIAPLPNVLDPIVEIILGDVTAWQVLFTLFSSVLNLVAFPFALAGLMYAWATRSIRPGLLIFHIPYWVTFVAIAGGNLIIHERYRVMASILMFGCAWLGALTSPPKLISRVVGGWICVLVLGATYVAAHKGGLI